jgi:hypothetical protein
LVAAGASLATLLPLAYYFKRFPLYGPLSLDAGDSFYYLTVARSSLHAPFFTFDGVHPTNGFHPAWQMLLWTAMQHGVLSATDTTSAVNRLAILNLLFLSVASALFALFVARQLRRPWIACVAVCPGFLWLVAGPAVPQCFANWSFCNGMETSLELFFFGLALLVLPWKATWTSPATVEREFHGDCGYRLILSGLLFGCTVLSRLDDVFYLLPLSLLFLRTFGRRSRGATTAAVALPTIMLLAYLIYNRIVVGVYLPTSGTVKAGFALADNLSTAFHTIFLLRFQESPGSPAPGLFPDTFERAFQMVAPLVVCGYYLWKKRHSWGLVQALCAGVVLKGLYNLVFVSLFNQGPWYYGVSMFMSNLVIAIAIDDLLAHFEPKLTTSWRSEDRGNGRLRRLRRILRDYLPQSGRQNRCWTRLGSHCECAPGAQGDGAGGRRRPVCRDE